MYVVITVDLTLSLIATFARSNTEPDTYTAKINIYK